MWWGKQGGELHSQCQWELGHEIIPRRQGPLEADDPVKQSSQAVTDNFKALPSSAVVCVISASAPRIHPLARARSQDANQSKKQMSESRLISTSFYSNLPVIVVDVGPLRLFLFIPDLHQLIGSCLLCAPSSVYLCI